MQKARRRLSAPTACRRTVSGSISLPCPGCFPPFPHGTGSLSVFRSYLALRDGPRCFGQDSSCPALLRKRPKHSPVTRTGLSPSADRLSRRFRFLAVPSRTPLLPRLRLDAGGLGSSPFARHYSGNRFFLSSPAGTKMFQFPAFAPASQPVHGIRPCGFPHSDSHGSIPVCGSPWISPLGRRVSQTVSNFFSLPRSLSVLSMNFLLSPHRRGCKGTHFFFICKLILKNFQIFSRMPVSRCSQARNPCFRGLSVRHNPRYACRCGW